MISPLMRKLLVRGGYMEKADDGTGQGGGTGGGGGDPKPADPKPADPKPADPAPTGNAADDKALADARAALDKANADLAAVKAQLQNFDGLDAAAVRKLVEEQRQREEEALAKRGEWDALKAQMVGAHTTELESERAKTAEATQRLSAAEAKISELTVGAAFSQSKFVSERLNMPAGKVRALFGSHFAYEGDKVVGFNKPAGAEGRAKLVDGRGEPLSFDLAMEALVNADPDKDDLLKPTIKAAGAGSGASAGAGGGPGADTSGLTGRERIRAALAARR